MHVHVQVLRICNYAVGVLCVRGRAIAATSIATYAIATTSAIATAVIATAVTASVTTGTGDSKPTAASKPAAVAYSIAARAARTRGNASPPSPHTATRPVRDATVRSGRRPDAEPGLRGRCTRRLCAKPCAKLDSVVLYATWSALF